MTGLRGRLRSLLESGLFSNASALMASTVGSGALGLAFWVVSAHLYTADQVGRVSAEVASITLLASLGQITLTSMFARFLPLARRRTGKIIRLGYGVTLAATWLLGCGFVALGLGRNYLSRDPLHIGVFVASILIFAVFALEDVVMTSMRKAKWVLAENVSVAIARLALLPVFLIIGRNVGVLGAWALPMVGAVIVVNLLVFRRLVPVKEAQGSDTGLLPTRQQLVNFGAAQFITGIITNIATMLPPVLVATKLGTTSSAVFYFPWLICTSVNALLWNIVFALIVEAMHDAENTRAMLRRAATMVMGVTCALALFVGFGAGLILSVVGSEYKAQGSTVLELIALSLPFVGVNSIYGALVVIDRRMWFTTVLDCLGTTAFITGGLLLASDYGVGAFGLSFLITQVASAMVAVPGIMRRYKRLVMLDRTVIIHLDEAEQTRSMANAQTQIIFMSVHAGRRRPRHALDEPDPRRLPDLPMSMPPHELLAEAPGDSEVDAGRGKHSANGVDPAIQAMFDQDPTQVIRLRPTIVVGQEPSVGPYPLRHVVDDVDAGIEPNQPLM